MSRDASGGVTVSGPGSVWLRPDGVLMITGTQGIGPNQESFSLPLEDWLAEGIAGLVQQAERHDRDG